VLVGIPEIRSVALRVFPYVVIYSDDADAVRVHRVLHSSRDLPIESGAGRTEAARRPCALPPSCDLPEVATFRAGILATCGKSRRGEEGAGGVEKDGRGE